MKKISVAVLAVTILLSGCGQAQSVNLDNYVTKEEYNKVVEERDSYKEQLQAFNENVEKSDTVNQTESKTINNKSDEKENKSQLSDSDFSTKEYLYENTIGDTLYFIIVTNNSDTDVSISANGTAKDANGNSIGAGSMDIDIIGAGETSIGYFYFDNVTGIDKVEYKLKYDEEPYYSPVINNLSVEQTLNDKNVILSVTNNGDKSARFVESYVLFLDSENNIIKYDRNYITDDDSEIKSGDTISVQLDCYKGYDHVEIYYTGRADK